MGLIIIFREDMQGYRTLLLKQNYVRYLLNTDTRQKRLDKLTSTHYMDQNGAIFQKHWNKHGCRILLQRIRFLQLKKLHKSNIVKL